MMDNNRICNRIRRMDEMVTGDRCRWLNQDGFLKAYNLRFMDSVDRSNFYESGNQGYSVENGHRRIMKERKLTSCDNGKDRSNGIMRGGGIRSRAVFGQEGSWRKELCNRDSQNNPGSKG